MRVITGEFKGRRLIAPDGDSTRPVTDRVKEAVFSSIGSDVVGARVVDLFAGAGSFGIEAASRGANLVVFVESGHRALDALRRNLRTIGLRAEIVSRRVEDYLTTENRNFDIAFCDPPWTLASRELGGLVAQLAERMADRGLIVISRRAGDEVVEVPGWRIDADKRYGDTRILQYRSI